MSASHDPDSSRELLEAALRQLAARPNGLLAEVLEDALRHPDEDSNRLVVPLIQAHPLFTDRPPTARAEALAQFIEECAFECATGKDRARIRAVLNAAFRFPEPRVTDVEPWASSLRRRHEQLKKHLPDVFDSPSTVQPMQRAWKDGVRRLAEEVQRQLIDLVEREALPLVPDQLPSGGEGRSATVGAAEDLAELQPASPLAQPVFMDLYVATVIMSGRRVVRRINDRLLTAQTDGVAHFKAQVYVAETDGTVTYVPTRAIFGCRAHDLTVPGSTKQMTLLIFPRPLLEGEQVYFTSEVVFGPQTGNVGDPDWINVDVDHFGIGRGQFDASGLRPTRGLTIRVHFDETELPRLVWWYAEADEKERETIPPAGDPRFLELDGCDVQHTFENVGQPRQNYGIAYTWSETRP